MLRRLVIGGPTLAQVPVPFAVDLAALYASARESGVWSSVTLGFIQSTYVHVGRNAVIAGALQRGASDLLWLDTDMTFPADLAVRLARHHRPIVACNCVMRDPRELFTAWRKGARVVTRPDSTGLEVVDRVGLAAVLMRLDLVADLPRPWFRHGLTDSGEDIGEDYVFCEAVRAAGHAIAIDHDCSKEIGHIGAHIYRPTAAPALAV